MRLYLGQHPARKVKSEGVCGGARLQVRHRNASVYQRLRALTASPARRFYVFSNEHHRWVHGHDSALPADGRIVRCMQTPNMPLICYEMFWRMQLALSAFAGLRQNVPPLEQSSSNAVRMKEHGKSLRHVASHVRV